MKDTPSKRPMITVRGMLSATLVTFVALFALGAYSTTALVTVPPIGALPEGATLWVWRSGAMRFIDSPDAMCARHVGGVSLLCRGAAIAAISDKVIARFSYSEALYLHSTDGQRYTHRASPPSAERDSVREGEEQR